MAARVVRLSLLALLACALVAAWLSIRWFGVAIGPLAAGLAGALVVLAMHPALVATNCILSRIHGDPVPADLRLSPWRALVLVDGEIDASVRGFWFGTPFRGAVPAPRAASDVPVRPHALLFVHGYFCNRAIWHAFMRDAARRGYVCEAVLLDGVFDDIDAHVVTVDAAIDALLARATAEGRPASSVIVVAHSMGGLVTRAALRVVDASRVAHVITLGSPHHGAWSARFGSAANIVQMRIGSPWLAALDDAERAGRGLPRSAYTTLFTWHDNIVYPQRSGSLEGARTIALAGMGHVALCYDKRVRAAVFERLDELQRPDQAAAT